MTVDSMKMAYARLALRQAVGLYLFDRDRKINLIDIGLPVDGGRAGAEDVVLRFHVDEKIPLFQLEAMGKPPIAGPIFGIPTQVIEGAYRPQLWPWWGRRTAPRANPRTTRSDPLRGGISISDELHASAGTLGGLVRDRDTHEPMLLSNWHVLVVEWRARRGQRIVQPGRFDGGGRADTIATLERDAMSANFDAAVAKLTPGSRQLINEQLDLGPVVGVGRAVKGLRVQKSGRTTEVTKGRVTGTDGVARMRYDGVDRIIRNVMTIEPLVSGAQTSKGGDSGSWWLDADLRAIGLHFAGSDVPERALALDMQSVLDALNVEIVPARQVAVSPEFAHAPRRGWAGTSFPGGPAARLRSSAAERTRELVPR